MSVLDSTSMKSLKKINTTLPEADVEYTFKFAKSGNITFVFVGLNYKQRLVLMNTETKRFSDMSAGYFNYLKRHQLISIKRLKTAPEKIVEAVKTPAEDLTLPNGIMLAPSIRDNKDVILSVKKNLAMLDAITPAQAFSIQSIVGVKVDELRRDFLYVMSKDNVQQQIINRTFQNLIKAQEVLSKLQVVKKA